MGCYMSASRQARTTWECLFGSTFQRKGRKMGFDRERIRGVVLQHGFLACALAALLFVVAMAFALPTTAYALDGPKQDAYNAATTTGASDDPFKVVVRDPKDGFDSTRPSAFWSGTGVNAAGGTKGITPFAVTFEQRVGNAPDGALVSSMTFDMHTGLHKGEPTVGLYMSGRGDVWNIEKPTWNYAFRLAPSTAQDTSTGDLRISFAWKGCFATYFDNWEYAFDAVTATAGLAPEKQLKPGDVVVMEYYGSYDVGQTSRGTRYVVDFNDTTTENVASGGEALGTPVGFTAEAVVGDDGFARFSGDNTIKFGGNYTVTKKATPVTGVTGVTLDKSTVDLLIGGQCKLNADVQPADAANKDVAWSSSNDEVASVAADGTVIARKTGTARVTATTADGGHTAACDVNVVEYVVEKAWSIGSPNEADVTASLRSDGVLVIEGAGDIERYQGAGTLNASPWVKDGLADKIVKVEFLEGVAPSSLQYLFCGCASLEEVVNMPSTVTSLFGAFQDCTSLEIAPAIPVGVMNLNAAFSGCTSLKAAPVIPAGVTSMMNAFKGCVSLAEAPTVPDGVKTVMGAFMDCTSLEKAPLLPASVTKAMNCFSGCTSLTELPAGFRLPASKISVFAVGAPYSADNPLVTYVADKADLDALNASYDWSKDGRVLALAPAGSEAVEALGSAAAAAEAALAGVVVSADGSDVVSSMLWVTPGAKQALEDAVAVAKELIAAPAPAAADVEAASSALAAALAAYQPAPGIKADEAPAPSPGDGGEGSVVPGGQGSDPADGGSAGSGFAGSDAPAKGAPLAATGDAAPAAALAFAAAVFAAIALAAIARRRRG